jgi:hypothetical protein
MISDTLYEAAEDIRGHARRFGAIRDPDTAEKIRIVLAVMEWVRVELDTVPGPTSEALTARCFDGIERSLSPVADMIERGIGSLYTEAARLRGSNLRN